MPHDPDTDPSRTDASCHKRNIGSCLAVLAICERVSIKQNTNMPVPASHCAPRFPRCQIIKLFQRAASILDCDHGEREFSAILSWQLAALEITLSSSLLLVWCLELLLGVVLRGVSAFQLTTGMILIRSCRRFNKISKGLICHVTKTPLASCVLCGALPVNNTPFSINFKQAKQYVVQCVHRR